MRQALALILLLALPVLAAPRARPGQAGLDQAQRDFARGDFAAALKALDAAAAEASEPALLSRVHLLRGQCFAAQQDFNRAEEAFRKALEADPEASLDPSRVDPAVVRMLDGLRARLKGPLAVRASRPSRVTMDGAPLGATPFSGQVPIGKHVLEARSVDGGASARQEVVVRLDKETAVDLSLVEAPRADRPCPEEATGTTAALGTQRPFGDLRGVLDPFRINEGVGLEIGAGLEFPYVRVSGHVRVFPEFGLAVRGALSVPLVESTKGYVMLEATSLFYNQVAIGLGGAGGVEYLFTRWVGVFGEVGGRHYFLGPGDPDRLILSAGVRLRLP